MCVRVVTVIESEIQISIVVWVWVVTVLCEKEVTVIECAIGGLQKSGKFGCSGDTFWQRLVTVDFDDGSFEKYGQFII